MDYAAFSAEIAQRFPGLSPQLQKAARHVLDRPDDVALLSMRRLATGAGVHPSTMVRLARALECDSYARFREPFQQRLRVGTGGYLDRARDLQARGAKGGAAKGATKGTDSGGAQLLDDVLQSNGANLRQTFDANGARKFIDCARALADAERLFIVGLRSVYPVAFFFDYAYRMFRDNGVLMDGAAGTLADDLRTFGPGDVILAVSFDPYSFETVRAVEYAKHHGGKVVVMTDSLISPLAKSADTMLIIRTESPSFFHSVSAGMAAAEALIILMVAEGGDEALESIRESEEQLEIFHAYWDEKPARSKSKGKKK